MFEDITERLDTDATKPLAKVRFTLHTHDPFPRIVVTITKALLERLQWRAGATIGLAVGTGEDKGKLKITCNSNVAVAKLRHLKLGGAIIDFGPVKLIDELFQPVCLPSKAATVLVEQPDHIMLQMPEWADNEAVQKRTRKRKNARREETVDVDNEPQEPVSKKAAPPSGRPLVNLVPPSITYNNKKILITEFQAILIAQLVRGFQNAFPGDVLIKRAYAEAGKPVPPGAETNLPTALLGVRLDELGLKITFTKGMGWGIDKS